MTAKTLSLNEVEALAKKAARGAGFGWGLAEEAGKATRWLCARDVDGCAALAAVLSVLDGQAYAGSAPVLGEVWTAPGGRLCPIATGAALSDHADVLSGPLCIEAVLCPILLAPFASGAAQYLRTGIVLEWDGACVATDGAALRVDGDVRSASATVTLRFEDAPDLTAVQPVSSRARPDARSLTTLERFAHRTYAPATAASRMSGAGAGLSDND